MFHLKKTILFLLSLCFVFGFASTPYAIAGARAQGFRYSTFARTYSTSTAILPKNAEIAIERYIADSKAVNEPLRRKDLDCLRSPLVHNLDLSLRILPPIPNLPLFRVEQRKDKFWTHLQPGHIITSEGYLSTSRNPHFFKFAHRYPYFGRNYNVRYIIETHWSGRAISRFSPCRNRLGAKELDEVLFPRQSKFRIREISHENEVTTLRLEEVLQEHAPASEGKIQESDFRELHEDLC